LSPVIARACPLFVPLAEEGWTDGEVPRLVAERYLGDLRHSGSTQRCWMHALPLLAPTIAEVLGPRVAIVDSAEAITRSVVSLLGRTWLAAQWGSDGRGHATLCTELPHASSRRPLRSKPCAPAG